LELGCGSALPTAMMFSKALRERRAWKFILQDYNDIFGLVTVPNLFLTWYVQQHPNEDDMTVTPELKSQFLSELKEIGIEFKFLVGAWSPALLVRP
jgi:protein-histidine N-methyltransferase